MCSKGRKEDKQMSSKKKVIAVVITTVALTVGSVGFSQAASKPMGGGHTAHHEANDAEREARQALVSKTIGVDSATIRTRLAAGESLGAIAGAKKAELIAVLVADHTKRIDADVTAGKLTAAQATTLKAELTAHVTAKVDQVGGKGGPRMGEGDKGGRGHHGGPGMGGMGKAPKIPATAGSPA
jgi:hypothetical protein